MAVPTFSRRKALAVAAMAALTLGAAGAAVAANTGLLGGSHDSSPVGTLDARNVSELLPAIDVAADPASPSVGDTTEFGEVPVQVDPSPTEAHDDDDDHDGDHGDDHHDDPDHDHRDDPRDHRDDHDD